MSVFDPSNYTDHERISEIIAKLESLREDLEEINSSEALEDIDPFLIHKVREESVTLLDELQLLEENVAGAEFNQSHGDDA